MKVTMITFKLQRQVGTPFYTLGVLTEESTGFRCKTLEKPMASFFQNPNPAFVCVAEGTHRMKMVNVGLDFSFGFSLNGTFRNAIFSGEAKPSKATAGSVCLGTNFVEGKGMEGGEKVMRKLNQLIDYLINQGRLNPAGKLGEVCIEITQDDCVTMPGANLDEVKQAWEPDWDCIEEEDYED